MTLLNDGNEYREYLKGLSLKELKDIVSHLNYEKYPKKYDQVKDEIQQKEIIEEQNRPSRNIGKKKVIKKESSIPLSLKISIICFGLLVLSLISKVIRGVFN